MPIYGGVQGIGRGVALESGRRVARQAIADINEAGAREAAEASIATGGETIALRRDLTDEASVHAAAAAGEFR